MMRPRRYARVFADLLQEVGDEESPRDSLKGGGLSAMGRAMPLSTRRHEPPSGSYFDVSRDDLEDMSPKLRHTVKTTLRGAKATAQEALAKKQDTKKTTTRSSHSSSSNRSSSSTSTSSSSKEEQREEWAKFWEPMQRCCYFVSSKTGESRWAAHFDEQVMVLEADDGSFVSYIHSLTGRKVDGPEEASVGGGNGRTVWCTLVDPVSGQVYYFSQLSKDSRWECPLWIDYYSFDHCAVYYVNTETDESQWEEPDGFRDDAEASVSSLNTTHLSRMMRMRSTRTESKYDESKDHDDKENFASSANRSNKPPVSPPRKPPPSKSPCSYSNRPLSPVEGRAFGNNSSKKGNLKDILYSYQKRPKMPYSEYAKFSDVDFEEESGDRQGKLPVRELRFGDTLVLSDLMGLD